MYKVISVAVVLIATIIATLLVAHVASGVSDGVALVLSVAGLLIWSEGLSKIRSRASGRTEHRLEAIDQHKADSRPVPHG